MRRILSLLPEVIVILSAVLLRLLPHPANVAPIGALALFGGVYLDRKYAYILPLVALFVSDLILGFHSTMVFVYASFILTSGIGVLVRRYKTIFMVTAASLFSSVLFFFITNTGVWLTTPAGVYAKTWSGWVTCLAYGLPFFRNTLIGDLLYLGAFVGVYTLLTRIPALQCQYANLYKKR